MGRKSRRRQLELEAAALAEAQRRKRRQLPPPPEVNVSKEFLKAHRRDMKRWYSEQWEKLVLKQECAVEAVKVEWIIQRNKDVKQIRKSKKDLIKLSPEEEKRLSRLMERTYIISV